MSTNNNASTNNVISKDNYKSLENVKNIKVKLISNNNIDSTQPKKRKC